MKMKMKMLAAAIGSLVSISVYAQETYSFEGAMMYSTVKADDNASQSGTLIGGAYYFKPVVLSNSQPFMELEFLQKASSVSLITGNQKYEDDTFVKTTINPVWFAGKIYMDKLVLGLSTNASDSDFSLKSNTSRYYGIRTTTNKFNIGYFVTDNTTVSFNNENSNASYARSTTALTSISDLKRKSNGISTHTVMPLAGTQTLVVDFSYKQIKNEQATSQTNNEYGAIVRYYPEAKYYFEGGYSNNTGDYARDKGNTVAFGLGMQITPRFGLMLSSEKFNVSDSTQKTGNTSTTLTAGYRF